METCGTACRFCPALWRKRCTAAFLHLHHTLTHLHYRVELTKECFHAGYFAFLVVDGKYLWVTGALLLLSIVSILAINGDE